MISPDTASNNLSSVPTITSNNLNALKRVLAGDGKEHSGSILNSLGSGSEISKRQNSIDAVSNLLKSFLNQGSVKLIQELSKKDNTAASMNGASGFGKKVNPKYLPSYNVRTPVVNIKINGYSIYPTKWILGSNTSTNARLNFQSFNLKMPLGGIEKTVQGSIVLFTKNPEELLNYVESWATQEDKDKSISGFPILSLTFGWAFSDSKFTSHEDIQVNTISAMSPELKFMITNIQMDDPGAAGTIFTFTLQDIGTVVLDNSSDNLIINSDWPQQQLRTLLEGILRIRLFTLDDILYLGKFNVASTGSTSVDAGANKTGSTVGILNSSDYSDITKNFSSDINNILNTPENLTFFTNTKNSDFCINNRSFLTVANDLASQCRCKWYPHKNTVEDYQKTTTDTSTAMAALNTLSLDLKTLKSMSPNAAISADLSQQLTSDLGITSTNNGLGIAGQSSSDFSTSFTTVANAIDTLTTALKANMARLASTCRLVWIPNVPVSWNTSGSVYYSNITNTNDTNAQQEPYKEGAYFLLPDILTDYDLFAQDLPIQYGPGASNMPYFYGSGQNVFQASLGSSNPGLFGEVLSLNVSHSNLIAILSQSVNESIAYGIEGKRLTGLSFADGFQTDTTKITQAPITTDSSSRTADQRAAANAIGQQSIDKIKKSILDSSYILKFRRNLGLASGYLLLGDDVNVSGPAKSLPTSDPGGVRDTASLKLKSRVANFLGYPTTAAITVLGDPNLLRLGPGCFELFSYYPVELADPKTGIISVTQKLNALTSGVYFVTNIEHTISGGDFTTTLSGTKAVGPWNVPSSITNKIRKKVITEITDTSQAAKIIDEARNSNYISGLSDSLSAQFDTVDLNSTNFKGGILATEFNTILSTYQQLAISPITTNIDRGK